MTPRISPHRPGRPAIAVAAAILSISCAGRSAPAAGSLPAPGGPRPKVGVALGGGGARGFAEIGVLRVLEQEKVPIDIVVGTSVGSLIGALYADSGRVLDAEFLAVSVEEEDLFDYGAFAFFSGGFIKGERLRAFIESKLRNKSIESMAVRYAAVATEIRTGQPAVFDRGPIAPAVHASCAIPGAFVPVTIEGRTYVDGGVTTPVPAGIARRMGADVVIAVSIPAALPEQTPGNPVAIAFHAVTIMSAEIGRLRAREADVVITPDVGDVAYDDFSRKKQLIEAGESAARAAMPSIRAAIAARATSRPAAGAASR